MLVRLAMNCEQAKRYLCMELGSGRVSVYDWQAPNGKRVVYTLMRILLN